MGQWGRQTLNYIITKETNREELIMEVRLQLKVLEEEFPEEGMTKLRNSRAKSREQKCLR